MRIVHISDIHFGCLTKDIGALFDKRALGLLNYFTRRRGQMHEHYFTRAVAVIRSLKPDLVVLTGDLTCVGSPEEFALAHERLRLLADDADFQFLAVPGNHDAYVKRRSCRDAMHRCFRELNGPGAALDDMPFERNFGNLRLFVLDEARPSNLVTSTGRLPPRTREWLQARTAREREDPTERRILVGHFPVLTAGGLRLGWRRRLHGDKQIHSALCKGQLDASVCGHIHDSFRIDYPSGAIEVCVGALTVQGRISVLDYTPATGKLTQHWHELDGVVAAPVGAVPAACPFGA